MKDDFSVGLRPEDVSFLQELPTQFPKVVDFAVENNPDRFVLVRHRLTTGIEVNDRQAQMAQSNIPIKINALAVRPAMTHRPKHHFDLLAINTRFVVE